MKNKNKKQMKTQEQTLSKVENFFNGVEIETFINKYRKAFLKNYLENILGSKSDEEASLECEALENEVARELWDYFKGVCLDCGCYKDESVRDAFARYLYSYLTDYTEEVSWEAEYISYKLGEMALLGGVERAYNDAKGDEAFIGWVLENKEEIKNGKLTLIDFLTKKNKKNLEVSKKII